jgi:Integrase core domain
MHIQSKPSHGPPLVDLERERGGTHDNDGFVLSAHPDKSQGRPRTTPSSRLISQSGLPDRVSQQRPSFREPTGSRRRRTAVSSPDNGSAYRAHQHRLACQQLALKHTFTRPYRPRTNGKAERFIQTLINDWAYGRLYANSTERTATLSTWLDHYNYTRPHGSLGHKPPSSRLTKAPGNNT